MGAISDSLTLGLWEVASLLFQTLHSKPPGSF